ncbi:MAG TPA: ATP synthase F1 subunit delta [candidate division Zixibacteria bacterium]|nr:F0F1 ATP synthase subunit delta [candidate division Zixibacteria bacterium]MDD4918786.1 ATP synthase F1 subunit delta [candidate division Zixibacteria bacterium]MDM7973017.1 ATP synthase F1 subunit delta [candidate division Zixibacteria bacterium]HOD65984.1 ATP synthase F1 subunit delta [candidate division Zixibacteria bacterium]HOZ08831.1 ATP synthase F1 subunit delta [candidate division Zixibacteria bacterium]
MLAQEVAQRYAHALFDAAREKGLLDAGYSQMADLRTVVRADRTLLNFLTAPQVLDEHKIELLRTVFGSRLQRLFVEFLVVLVGKHRINYLVEIIDEFVERVEKAKGIGRARVISAVPLSGPERENLVGRLSAKTGLQIRLEVRIDPAILGGLIVILHNEIIDGSIRHGLGLIEEQLLKVKVN